MSDENAEQTEEPTQKVINLNINDARIAKAKEQFKDVDAYVDLDAAKVAKKVLTTMRTTLSEAHKREKKQILIDGRRLDGEKNRLLALIAEIEDPISEKLTEIKEKVEREETARIEKIENEIERIKAFANDRHDLSLEELNERRAELATIEISEDFFQEFAEQAQTFKDEADAKLRIAMTNELERVLTKAKQDRIAEENAAKQKELDERQAKMDAEETDRKAAQKKIDDEATEKLALGVFQRQAELDKQAEDQTAEQKKIDDENARIAQETADKEESERKEQEEREAEEKRLAAAPDAEKLEHWVEELDAAFGKCPLLDTDIANKIKALASSKLIALIGTIKNQIEEMK